MTKYNKCSKIKIVSFFISILIFISALTNSISLISNDYTKYSEFSKKENLTEYVGKRQDEIEKMYNSLIDYINKKDEKSIYKYFNEKEIAHMYDVQKLFELNTILKYLSIVSILFFIIYIIFSKNKEEKIVYLEKIIKYSLITLSLIIFLGIIIALNFNQAFLIFHKLSFANDLWLLDPNTDIMIRMLPENFFMFMAIEIFKLFFIIFSLILLIIYICKKYIQRS